jgi:competence protein ComEA
MESAHVVPSRSARVRVGTGAAIVLVLVAFGIAVLVSLLGASRATESIPLRGGEPAASSADQDAGEAEAGSGPGSAEGATPGGSSDPPGASPGIARIFVHILGAVERPGLYELGVGGRGIDAVAAAGGFTAEADQGGLNLARLLVDGEQIVVPIVGEAPPPGAGGSAAPGGGPVGAAAGGLVDLNTADAALLDTLPGVGPATAQRILDWRETNGGFTSIEDLLSVSGIGEKTFADLEGLVTV